MEVGASSVDDLRPKRKTLTRAEYLSSQRHLRRLDMSGEATDQDFDDDDVHRCKLIPLAGVGEPAPGQAGDRDKSESISLFRTQSRPI